MPITVGEREQKWKQGLQRRVLQHLKSHGPKHYNNLSLLFDPHGTGDTRLAVEALKSEHYVEIGQDGRVTITASGIRLLAQQV